MLKRRSVLQAIGGAALAGPGMVAGLARAAEKVPLTTGLPPGEYDTAVLDALPGKKPLIKLSYRPPNYETPVSYFASDFTPNDAFFVRYHLADIPDKIDPASWKVKIGGEAAATPIELGLSDLQSGFEQVELAAVCQCSGNRRGLSDPHVPGVQWGLGAMGNALWKGVRLKDVLGKVGLKKEAIELVLNGAEGPVVDKTPDFVKSIPVWKALDENTLIAYQMNGQPLPHLNGAPARLIVPGWTATYWTKHVVSIEAVTKPFEGFWMKSAYRIPTGKFPVVDRFLTQELPGSTPITEMVVNSLIVTPGGPVKEKLGKAVELRGIAWDGGYGITRVEISSDGGATWQDASLGKDLGRFAFRPWSYRFAPKKKGQYAIIARASNKAGQTQAESLIFNPAGYHNNVPRPLSVTIA
ncbi:MAG TPA: molybdopterin-dependent oxidoreductase [Stellaceae bacterium]|jgi:DMSO/TMAO reductase YedYZ molybdopterin-dependent catalytic subunit|nr:molybdopterin-dependent oxidoreductase [Stellaceae bacterium]